jgi:FAD synthase
MIRDEKKFDTFDELVERVRLDVEAAKSFFELRGDRN